MALPSLFRRERSRPAPIQRGSDPLGALHGEMSRLFEETDDEIRVTAELPGLDEKDVELRLDRDTLSLRGEKRRESEAQRGGWTRSERAWGRFERSVALPCEVDVDAATAEFRRGVLRVTLPKDPAARRRRVQIPVRAA